MEYNTEWVQRVAARGLQHYAKPTNRVLLLLLGSMAWKYVNDQFISENGFNKSDAISVFLLSPLFFR